MLFTEGIIFTTKPEIHEKMLFDSLDELKFFLVDYAVKHYRPFTVVDSDRNLMYEVMCKQGFMWHVWARLQRGTGKWKITKVVEPHTCRSSQVKGVHAQLTASYIGRCILGVVRDNSEVTASSLIEQMLLFAGYRVKYSNAWQAKQHAIALLWGDWKESYAKIPRVLKAMNHFNPGVIWFPYMTGLRVLDGCVLKPVLLRVFWCFPQCKVAFQHCRPVILIDGTFLTGKYRGTLMMAVAVDLEQQLVPLAFALAESENDDSWSWFMRLVRINILGPTRQVCMISDRHHGLIKCASDHLDGYQPLIHRWCIRHFAANMWRRQKNKKVIGKLKLLASVHTEDKFKEVHKDLVKHLNEEAKD
jgi:hypothetical protein